MVHQIRLKVKPACPLNKFCALREVRGSSFVDGGAGIGDESNLESLDKDGGTAEISQFEQNQSVQGSVGEF